MGIEIEFMGPPVAVAAAALANATGGRIAVEDPHAVHVRDTPLGDLQIELDLRHVHPGRPAGPRLAPSDPRLADWLGRLAAPFVPRELIVGPVEPERLGEVDRLAAVLRGAGATGQGTTRFAGSLGLHFNIDPPELDPAAIAALLSAYIAAEPSLRAAIAGGDARRRRLMPPPFPVAYAEHLRTAGPAATWESFAADYLAHNPTRDRGLDLLPLLLSRRPEQVRAALPDEKIAARPVLHYRLPQAHVGDPAWSLAADWNRWVALERSAAPAREASAGG